MSDDTDSPVMDTLAAMTAASLENSNLDDRELMLVRTAALVATGAPAVSYLMNTGLLPTPGSPSKTSRTCSSPWPPSSGPPEWCPPPPTSPRHSDSSSWLRPSWRRRSRRRRERATTDNSVRGTGCPESSRPGYLRVGRVSAGATGPRLQWCWEYWQQPTSYRGDGLRVVRVPRRLPESCDSALANPPVSKPGGSVGALPLPQD
jgi:hypothetical protein